MALLPGVCVLGSAAFAIVKATITRRSRGGGTFESSDDASDWLLTLSTGATERKREQFEQRAIEGQLVCFTEPEGLLAVRFNGSTWGLVPIGFKEADVITSATAFPSASIFCVVDMGEDRVGFRSWGAGGRMLQAVRDKDLPHRVANYNTGPWESWEFSPQGLVNSKWDKDLGFEVHEVNVVAREALEWSETLNKNYAQHLMQQNEDMKAGKIIGTSEEVEAMQLKLKECERKRQEAEREAAQVVAVSKLLERRLAQQKQDRDQAEQKYWKELNQMREDHEREVRDLIEQRDIAQKSAIVTVKQGVEQARMQVEKALLHKEVEVQRIKERLHVRDVEFEEVLADRNRMDAALQCIKVSVDHVALSPTGVQASGEGFRAAMSRSLVETDRFHLDGQRPDYSSSSIGSRTGLGFLHATPSESGSRLFGSPSIDLEQSPVINPMMTPKAGDQVQGSRALSRYGESGGSSAAIPGTALQSIFNSDHQNNPLYHILSAVEDSPRVAIDTPRILSSAMFASAVQSGQEAEEGNPDTRAAVLPFSEVPEPTTSPIAPGGCDASSEEQLSPAKGLGITRHLSLPDNVENAAAGSAADQSLEMKQAANDSTVESAFDVAIKLKGNFLQRTALSEMNHSV